MSGTPGTDAHRAYHRWYWRKHRRRLNVRRRARQQRWPVGCHTCELAHGCGGPFCGKP